MDIEEATERVMSNIKRLDPENATRIMGYIMIQDQGDKEMIRLAFFSDTALLSYINQAKAHLGIIPSNSSPSSSAVQSNNIPFPKPATSPRVMIPNNGFHLPKPSSPFSRASPRQPVSYASVLNGSSPSGGQVGNFSGQGLSFYGGGGEIQSDFLVGESSVGHLPYFDDSVVDAIMSPSGMSDSVLFPYGGGGGEEAGNSIVPPFHRRSSSVNDAAFFEDNVGGFDFGRRCMYFARGNCRNGSACKFAHSEFNGDGFEVGSPSKIGSGFDDLLRIKALQQRFALMGSSGAHHNPFSSHNRSMSFLEGNPRRSDFSHMGFGNVLSSSARQIYLTFPADSTFKEEDVTKYFSDFGPVTDVRIPYQQKRMFGFVTFVSPETVKLILARGNPHFVCDSRVLVKPYKEKGKFLEKKHFHQQHWEKSDFSFSPSAFDSRELYDLPVGPRMLNSQEMIMRRKFEQEAELHHAIERQSLKMMNLQLMDLNNNQLQQHNYHFPRGLPTAFSPRQMNHNFVSSSAADNGFTQEEVGAGENTSTSLAVGNDGGESYLPESGFENVLPENPFTSLANSDAEHKQASFACASTGNNDDESATDASSDKTASISGNSTFFR